MGCSDSRHDTPPLDSPQQLELPNHQQKTVSVEPVCQSSPRSQPHANSREDEEGNAGNPLSDNSLWEETNRATPPNPMSSTQTKRSRLAQMGSSSSPPSTAAGEVAKSGSAIQQDGSSNNHSNKNKGVGFFSSTMGHKGNAADIDEKTQSLHRNSLKKFSFSKNGKRQSASGKLPFDGDGRVSPSDYLSMSRSMGLGRDVTALLTTSKFLPLRNQWNAELRSIVSQQNAAWSMLILENHAEVLSRLRLQQREAAERELIVAALLKNFMEAKALTAGREQIQLEIEQRRNDEAAIQPLLDLLKQRRELQRELLQMRKRFQHTQLQAMNQLLATISADPSSPGLIGTFSPNTKNFSSPGKGKPGEFRELRYYPNPHVNVQRVLEAALILVGEEDTSWWNAQRVMFSYVRLTPNKHTADGSPQGAKESAAVEIEQVNPDRQRQSCRDLKDEHGEKSSNTRKMSRLLYLFRILEVESIGSRIQKLKPYVEDTTLDPLSIGKTSTAVKGVWMWVCAIYDLHTRNERLKNINGKLAQINEALGAKSAKLFNNPDLPQSEVKRRRGLFNALVAGTERALAREKAAVETELAMSLDEDDDIDASVSVKENESINRRMLSMLQVDRNAQKIRF